MLRLLSPAPQICLQQQWQPLTLTKPMLFLTYLALQPNWVSRSSLATFLRPDANESVARHHLRLLINRAKALPWATHLEVQTNQIRFVMPSDVQVFLAALGSTNWQLAIETYQAPLLQGANGNGFAFDEWLELERNQLQAAWREAMLAQSQILMQQQMPKEAALLLRQLWQNEPEDEITLVHYLKAAYLSGQREQALLAYQQFAEQLNQEYQEIPEPETLELYQLILNSQPLDLKIQPPVVPIAVTRPPKLVAREHEIKQLQNSQYRISVVIGEAGIGKTRLILETFPNARMLRCIQGLSGISYEPILTFIKTHYTAEKAASIGVYAPELARFLPEFSSSSHQEPDPQSGKMRLLEAFARFLELETEPVLFDDLQWADASTLEFITFYLARSNNHVIATIRHNEIQPLLEQTLKTWQTERIWLQPFTEPEVQIFLSSLIETEYEFPVFSEFLYRQTGGNIFFMLEVLRDLFARGALRQEAQQWKTVLDHLTFDYRELIIPIKVQELVLNRVARLKESTQHLIGAASVLAHLEKTSLALMTEQNPAMVLDGLEELEQNTMIRNEQFIHDILRQSIYQNLSNVRRIHFHEKAAALTNLALITRAEHYLKANQPLEAVPLLLEEGLKFQHQGLPANAITLFERALEINPSLLEAIANSALCHAQISQYEQALKYAQSLQENSSEPKYQAIAKRVQADWYYANGDLQNAAQLIEAALVLLEQFDYQEAHFEEIAFDIFEAQQRYPQAIEMLEKARKRLSPTNSQLAIILSSLAAIYDDTGRYAEALTLHFQALNIARTNNAKYVQINTSIHMMWALSHANRTDEAIAIAKEALLFGEYANTQYLRNGYAAALMRQEQYQEAVEQYEHNTKHGDITTRTLAWGRLSDLYQHFKRQADLENAVQKSLESAKQTQVSFAQMRACISILKYGTQQQLEQIMAILQPVKNPDPMSQKEFETALETAKKRGLEFLEKIASELSDKK